MLIQRTWVKDLVILGFMEQAALAVMSNPGGDPVVRVYRSARSYSERPVHAASPSQPIKFAVGSPGLRSGLWRVWSPRNKDDIYVKPISLESFSKISLHESGDWRHQVVSDKLSHPSLHFVRMPDPSSRILEQWERPDQYTEGWTEAVAILIPSEDVVPVPADHHKPTDVDRWVLRAPPGEMTEFRIDLVSEGAPALVFGWQDWRTNPLSIIGAYRTCGGQTVLVTHHRTRMTDSQTEAIERLRVEMSSTLSLDFNTAAHTGPRMIGAATDPDGCHLYLDLAIHPDR